MGQNNTFIIQKGHELKKVLQSIKLCLYGNKLFHGSALVGSDPHELTPGFEVCQMKDTHIGVSELTLFKSNEIGLFRTRQEIEKLEIFLIPPFE